MILIDWLDSLNVHHYVYYIIFFYMLRNIYRYFLRPSKNFLKYGDWAVITGSTSGIGKALSYELAKKGLNIVLISRTESKLKEIASDLERLYAIQTRIVSIDYNDEFNTTKSYNKITKVIQDIDVAVLVNNVGCSYPFPMYFHELSIDEINDLIQMNIYSTNHMTRLILPQIENNKKGGLVVNMGSGSGEFACPLLSVYSASKRYIDQLSLS